MEGVKCCPWNPWKRRQCFDLEKPPVLVDDDEVRGNWRDDELSPWIPGFMAQAYYESMGFTLGQGTTRTNYSTYIERSVRRIPWNFQPLSKNHYYNYLLVKLEATVQVANSIIEVRERTFPDSKYPPSNVPTECLDAFLMDLFALAGDASYYFGTCDYLRYLPKSESKKLTVTAIVRAIDLVQGAAMGFNLELYRIILDCKFDPSRSLTLNKVDSLWDTEVETFKAMFPSDEMARFQKLWPNPALKLSVKKLKIWKKGQFGTVYEASWEGTAVAVKRFYGPDDADFREEVSSWAILRHPNVVSIFGFTEHKSKLFHKAVVVMEKMHVNLHSFLKMVFKPGFILEPRFILEAIDMMQQISEGMNYLHENEIMHKDLRPQNILVKVSSFGHVQIKVADFGLWRTKVKTANHASHLDMSKWTAPELISGDKTELLEVKHDYNSDVYNFGMVCYEILTGHEPYLTLTSEQVRKNVLDGVYPQLPEQCPEELRVLIEKCWRSVPRNRPSFADICVALRHLKCILMMTYAMGKRMSLKRELPGKPLMGASRAKLKKSSVSKLPRLRVPPKFLSRELPSRRLIGKGPAGIVYETTWKGDKFARKDFIGVPSEIFVKEAKVLTSLQDHDNIVKTYGWTVDKGSCSLVLNYMDDDLPTLMQRRKESQRNDPVDKSFGCHSESRHDRPFDLRESVYIMLQIARGVKHLHEQGIVHGDLKTKNVLVSYIADGDQELEAVRVADFGLVDTKNNSMFFVSRQARALDMARWKAPEYLEIYRGQLSDDEDEPPKPDLDVEKSKFQADTDRLRSADVYSFAVTCSHILTGNEPYRNMNWKELMDKIVYPIERPQLPYDCPRSLKLLLESCWQPWSIHQQRPDFYKICEELEEIFLDITKAHQARFGEDQRELSRILPKLGISEDSVMGKKSAMGGSMAIDERFATHEKPPIAGIESIIDYKSANQVESDLSKGLAMSEISHEGEKDVSAICEKSDIVDNLQKAELRRGVKLLFKLFPMHDALPSKYRLATLQDVRSHQLAPITALPKGRRVKANLADGIIYRRGNRGHTSRKRSSKAWAGYKLATKESSVLMSSAGSLASVLSKMCVKGPPDPDPVFEGPVETATT